MYMSYQVEQLDGDLEIIFRTGKWEARPEVLNLS